MRQQGSLNKRHLKKYFSSIWDTLKHIPYYCSCTGYHWTCIEIECLPIKMTVISFPRSRFYSSAQLLIVQGTSKIVMWETSINWFRGTFSIKHLSSHAVYFWRGSSVCVEVQPMFYSLTKFVFCESIVLPMVFGGSFVTIQIKVTTTKINCLMHLK